MTRNVIENKKKETPFQMFFLKNDQDETVEVKVDEIDFEEVKSRLKRGESVYITRKREKKTDINFIAYELVKEPWYLLRS